MASRRSRRARVAAPADPATCSSPGSSRIAPALLVALLVPRLVRMLYPAIWVEDDCYLQSAFAMAHGLRPYLDFIHPQMPLLEWAAAGYISLAGASHMRMELV